MRYIAANTTIPVPKIYGWGTADENPTGLGPFMVMEYIEYERTLSEALKDPSLEIDDPHILDPNIAEAKVEFLYGQITWLSLPTTFPSPSSPPSPRTTQPPPSGTLLWQIFASPS